MHTQLDMRALLHWPWLSVELVDELAVSGERP